MKFNEAKKIVDFVKQVEKDIGDFATIAGVEAINFYTQNFRKQGFDDDGVKPWKGRKQRLRKGRDLNTGKAILVKTGALRRSLIKRKAGKLAVYIISPLPYANVHNEGLRAGRGRGFIMPKRQFVGDSKTLNRKILNQIDKRIKKAFQRS